MDNKTYVYEGIEVKMTGRTASRKTVRGNSSAETTLVEVTPVDESIDWKKWVQPKMLFTVEDSNEKDKN